MIPHPPAPSPLHILINIIIVVVGLLDDFLWVGCGESFFFVFLGWIFSLFIFLVVEFLDDFFGVSLSCAFCVYCEKCGGVSFSLLLLLLLFFFFLF